jgi:hypothetical protein
LPLRLVIGFGFAAHGYAKLSRGPENFDDSYIHWRSEGTSHGLGDNPA